MPLFAATIFCGAFLLFLVQPLMGKYLLPWFGGGPGIWTTCLLFFQALLLGGYAHAHFLQRLSPRRQAIVHGVLMFAALAFVPVIPDASWKPAGAENPALRILLLLTAVLGLPYLVLSATGPLMQRWFSLTHPGVSPYRLYALSNVGSLLALVAFPFFFEPLFTRDALCIGWSVGLVIFTLLAGTCAWRVAQVSALEAPKAAATIKQVEDKPPTLVDRMLWVLLPAVASLLLVAATNKLCLDIAAVPFLWVLPLGAYLVTFILCFDHPRWYHRGVFATLLGLIGCLATHFLATQAGAPLAMQVAALTALLFTGCMVCHGELYRLRPAPARLTGYYLAIAAGGAAGSLFVALGAPLLFTDFRELQVGLVLVLLLAAAIIYFHRARTLALGLAAGGLIAAFVLTLFRADGQLGFAGWLASYGRELGSLLSSQWQAFSAGAVVVIFALFQRWRIAKEWRARLVAIPLLLVVLLAAAFARQARIDAHDVHEAGRNFYGTYKVRYYDYSADAATHFYGLTNSGIAHGQQFLGKAESHWPTTYYSGTSGLGRAIAVLPLGPRHIGAVGLGTGTVAAYGRPGDSLRFYEINPAIVSVASHTFTYLKDTRATVSIALGDARLVMERELRSGAPPQYDLLVLDAFAGDAIPVHLLTREALAQYLRLMRPGGIIAVHISNRHLDLRVVVEALATDAGLSFATISDSVDPARWWLYNTTWVLLSTDATKFKREEVARFAQEPPGPDAKMVLWTDEHASLFNVMW